MVNQNANDIARKAKRIYQEKLRTSLEKAHMNDFVAIELISGEYFIGKTLSEAISASRGKYSDRLAHALRVGHQAAIHSGMQIR